MTDNLARFFQVSAFGEKNVGGRPHDEDAILVRPDLGLFAVADGAGGDNAGNIASSVALASLTREFEATRGQSELELVDALGVLAGARRLSRAVHRAHREVLAIAKSHDRYRGMGTTIVALSLQLEHGLAHLASVGDSTCFRMRSGNLEQLSEDHTLGRDVLELTPDFDDAAAARLPRNVITRALGMKDNLRVAMRSFDIANGDRFVLCSDGVADVLGDDMIVEVLQTTRDSEEHARGLIRAALGRGPDDNCAAVVVSVQAALGVSSIPKAHHARPLRKQRRDSLVPEPEIVIVEEELVEDSWETEVHAVPAPADEMMSDLRAFARFSKPKRS
ncbi:MAG: protein phosphatase 2C domain-containing protein [Sandaracinaceae bacterium]|nr:protein phosphatase 2C domain-containing protein [Sandaracinaceae bacterium]